MEQVLFVGTQEVTNVQETDTSTVVTLADGRVENFTSDQWKEVQSIEKYLDGDVSVRKWRPVIKQIIRTLKDNGCSLTEKGWVLERVDESINENHKRAMSKLYNVVEPGRITLKQIDDILLGSENSGDEA